MTLLMNNMATSANILLFRSEKGETLRTRYLVVQNCQIVLTSRGRGNITQIPQNILATGIHSLGTSLKIENAVTHR